MQQKQTAIIGFGGMARELTETLRLIKTNVSSINYFVEDEFYNEKSGSRLLSELLEKQDNFDTYMGIGDGQTRMRLSRLFSTKAEFPSVIHPTAVLGANVKSGKGLIAQQFVTITTNVNIGEFCQLNLYTGISHDCTIGDFFTASPKVSVAGNVHIGNLVTIGTNAAVLPGINICDNVIIGAGAVVTRNITKPGTYAGIPAQRLIKSFSK